MDGRAAIDDTPQDKAFVKRWKKRKIDPAPLCYLVDWER
jgi:hypothetical protein